jgi:hypothetical protein
MSTPVAPAGAQGQPELQREKSSFDFRTVREFTKLVGADKIAEAAKLMAEDVEWHAFDGRIISGRQQCQELLKQQKELGLRRKGLTDYAVQPKLRNDPDYDENLDTFTAQRICSFEKPDSVAARVVQTMKLKHGQIIKCMIALATWEPDLEPLELLRRFASLRASKKDDQAAVCLHPECSWRRFNFPDIFDAPQELSEPMIQGRELIKQLWAEQLKQGVSRRALSDWVEEEDSSLLLGNLSGQGRDSVKAATGLLATGKGQVFSRQAKISGKEGAKVYLMQQIAQVENGYIVTVTHNIFEQVDTQSV